METEGDREESDQLPEEQPPDQSAEDDASISRGEAVENPGVPNEQGQASGNPRNAG